MFEEDNTYVSEEQMKSRSKIREIVYETMYDHPYNYKFIEKDRSATTTYGGDASSTSYIDDSTFDNDSDIKPFDPKAEKPKPYIPPTKFDGEAAKPFGNLLDGPAG
jgi:hypothetical protein